MPRGRFDGWSDPACPEDFQQAAGPQQIEGLGLRSKCRDVTGARWARDAPCGLVGTPLSANLRYAPIHVLFGRVRALARLRKRRTLVEKSDLH